MPFVVGITLIGLGGLLVWGGLSGRLAKMAAAVLPPSNTASTTAFVGPDTGFQQLAISGGGAISPSANVPPTLAPLPTGGAAPVSTVQTANGAVADFSQTYIGAPAT